MLAEAEHYLQTKTAPKTHSAREGFKGPKVQCFTIHLSPTSVQILARLHTTVVRPYVTPVILPKSRGPSNPAGM